MFWGYIKRAKKGIFRDFWAFLGFFGVFGVLGVKKRVKKSAFFEKAKKSYARTIHCKITLFLSRNRRVLGVYKRGKKGHFSGFLGIFGVFRGFWGFWGQKKGQKIGVPGESLKNPTPGRLIAK